ncbi:arrestin-C-like [Sinocyclocheilus grahami]|uniref:arrestin-C-like n=1 Tax=Sinocyclocheilus grahami TaxID=75366 RepID=UPI0007AC87BE|nr:PREDICTED: arrestin-C-like [Sinocyclocheilus grahami]
MPIGYSMDQINANSTFEKEYRVTPLLANNKEKRGLALDGKLKDEDTNLASSTILLPNMDKQMQGLAVSYKIKVTLMMGGGLLGSLTLSDITAELPLVLMSPKPAGLISTLNRIQPLTERSKSEGETLRNRYRFQTTSIHETIDPSCKYL